MQIIYNDDQKDLPCDQLYWLFFLAGWADGPEDKEMTKKFNLPFIHSTYVISAWDGERLIGVVRVLSDTIIRSILYDLVIDPEYQGKGIGRELLKRCTAKHPNSQWLVQTEEKTAAYYEKLGFTRLNDVFLHFPSIYF